jgi:hypothetical protein
MRAGGEVMYIAITRSTSIAMSRAGKYSLDFQLRRKWCVCIDTQLNLTRGSDAV